MKLLYSIKGSENEQLSKKVSLVSSNSKLAKSVQTCQRGLCFCDLSRTFRLIQMTRYLRLLLAFTGVLVGTSVSLDFATIALAKSFISSSFQKRKSSGVRNRRRPAAYLGGNTVLYLRPAIIGER